MASRCMNRHGDAGLRYLAVRLVLVSIPSERATSGERTEPESLVLILRWTKTEPTQKRAPLIDFEDLA